MGMATSTFKASGVLTYSARKLQRPVCEDRRFIDGVEHPDHKTAMNSSSDTPAWRKTPARVPTLTSLCRGTTQLLEPRRRMTWLPDWRIFTNPNRSRPLIIVAPKTCGDLRHAREY